MKQFVVLVVILFMLGKEAFCEKDAYNFASAVEAWQKRSCIYPDKSLYKTAEANSLTKLEQCNILEQSKKPDSADDVFKTDLCQAFYSMTIAICATESFQPFIRNCLSPEIVGKINPFAENDVCSYIFASANYPKYFSFMKTRELCTRNCGASMNSMKDICELYAIIVYQNEHQKTCNATADRQPPKEEGKSKSVGQENGNQITITKESTPPPTTSDQIEKTSTTNLTVARLGDTTIEVHKFTNNVSSNGSLNTVANNSKSPSTVIEAQRPVDTSAQIKNESKTSVLTKDESTTSEPIEDEPKVPLPSEDKSKIVLPSGVEPSEDKSKIVLPSEVEPSKDKPKTLLPIAVEPSKDKSKTSLPSDDEMKTSESLLISKIMSTTIEGTVPTWTSSSSESEQGTIASKKQKTTAEKDVEFDDDNSEELDIKGSPSDVNEPDENNEDQSKQDKAEFDKDKIKTQSDNKDGSKGKLPGFETGRKQGQDGLVKKVGNQADDTDDDSESSPGSGHFLAYFLTAVVICISGYVIYHNKQKILAFIIEGRNSGRNGRQRSKDVKYSQLKSSVEEVMPSLEQTATGKNFVY